MTKNRILYLFLVLLLAHSYVTALLTTGVYVLSHALLRPSVQAVEVLYVNVR